jgi:acetylornithine/N-succinyldiaminopimelate aminotransferase
MTKNEDAIAHAKTAMLGNYQPAPIVLTRGRGSRVEDVDGRSYLDFAGGIAVTSVGHSHPKLAKAIADQAARLMHVSNLFYNDRAIELAEKIVARTGFPKVYFGNSGTEANEAMLKLARRYHHERGDKARVELVGTIGSFHGRTYGSLSLTGQEKYHVGMGPLLPGVHLVPYDDLDAMKKVVGEKTAAILVEPIQAEGGLRVPSPGYLRGLRELCDERGALLLLDEVQTGYGRTGKFLGAEHAGVHADACSLAKGIAGGFPFSAMLVSEKASGGLPYGSHASTFGGNPLACAAALSVLEIFDEESLVENAAAMGRYLGEKIAGLAMSDAVAEPRGMGLLRGLMLANDVDPGATIAAARSHGLLVTLAGGNVLRFAPALNVTRAEIDEAVGIVETVLEKAPRKAA